MLFVVSSNLEIWEKLRKFGGYLQAAAKARKDSLASEASSSGDKKLQNQFSFVERATQTMNNAFKVSNQLTTYEEKTLLQKIAFQL